MTEFTGERVIPGEVNPNLWSEHISRYAFARLFASGRVLDAGCGTGYGSAELAQTATSVVGFDLSPEAIAYACTNYPLPNVQFLAASATAAPLPDATFDSVVAFEVIEHLPDYTAFLTECARLLKPEGLLIVSSPNKSYYAESRGQTGPNPFHVREFERLEFEQELKKVFANVRIVLQDCGEAFSFHAAREFWPAEARFGGLGGDPDTSNFLIGICSRASLPEPKAFVSMEWNGMEWNGMEWNGMEWNGMEWNGMEWNGMEWNGMEWNGIYVPKAANILRERERHVGLLEKQLAQVNTWLSETQAERDSLLDLFRKQTEELNSSHKWAQDLANQLDQNGHRIVELQDAFAAEQQAATRAMSAYENKVAELEKETQARFEWGAATEKRLTETLNAKCQELADCVKLLETAESTVHERTLWAQRTEEQRQHLAAQLDLLRGSRWLKLGRTLNLGPVLDPS